MHEDHVVRVLLDVSAAAQLRKRRHIAIAGASHLCQRYDRDVEINGHVLQHLGYIADSHVVLLEAFTRLHELHVVNHQHVQPFGVHALLYLHAQILNIARRKQEIDLLP